MHSSCEIEYFVETHLSLQAVCDTPIARISGCVPSLRIYIDFIYFHAQIDLPHPSPPPPPPLPPSFDQNQAPTSLKTPPSPHRIFDLQDSLDKLMHFLPQLSDFVALGNRFYSFRAQTA